MNDAQRPSGSEQPNRGPDSKRLLARVAGAAIEWANATMILSMAQASHAETPDEEKADAARIAGAEEEVCDAEVALFTMLCGDDGYPVKDIAALRANAALRKSVPSLSPTPARGASSPESSLPESNNQSETP